MYNTFEEHVFVRYYKLIMHRERKKDGKNIWMKRTALKGGNSGEG